MSCTVQSGPLLSVAGEANLPHYTRLVGEPKSPFLATPTPVRASLKPSTKPKFDGSFAGNPVRSKTLEDFDVDAPPLRLSYPDCLRFADDHCPVRWRNGSSGPNLHGPARLQRQRG